MRSENQTISKTAVSKTENKPGSVILEMVVDESKKDKYKLILPLSYAVEFSELDSKGKVISSSSVALEGTKTIIKTPAAPSRWKLRVMKQSDLSETDPTGVPVTIDGDGSGDGCGTSDWLMVKREDLGTNSEKIVHGARAAGRTIILRQEEDSKKTT